MERIRVLIIDDSAFMRKVLSDLINSDDRLHVIGTARNGRDGLQKIEQLMPDVVTMDVEMPEMNGLEALQHIMQTNPIPVVMLSSLTKRGADLTLQAIDLGAVDFIAKPSGPISLDINKIQDDIVTKIIVAAKSRISPRSVMQEKQKPSKANQAVPSYKPLQKFDRTLVAIGTSTGGPRALQEVLTKLPQSLKAPLVIVQHMPPGFTKSLAERLDGLSDITVKEAEHGDELQNGTAYIAPGGQHLEIVKKDSKLIAELTTSPPVNGHRPAVNQMYQSISKLQQVDVCTVIMTGMGSDGTEGLKQVKQALPFTYSIGESAQTCVVYGMPRAAAEAGLINKVCDVQEIAAAITARVRQAEGVN